MAKRGGLRNVFNSIPFLSMSVCLSVQLKECSARASGSESVVNDLITPQKVTVTQL